MAAAGATVQVKDYRLFMAALAGADKKTRKAARDELRKAGDHVKTDAAVRMAHIDARSAAGYKTRVRQRGIAVEQSIRRTTGKHPEFGALQMRKALVPALDANEQHTVHALEHALDRVCDEFNRGGLMLA
jgi:hypothetical protein